jgi:hypothetical protein
MLGRRRVFCRLRVYEVEYFAQVINTKMKSPMSYPNKKQLGVQKGGEIQAL